MIIAFTASAISSKPFDVISPAFSLCLEMLKDFNAGFDLLVFEDVDMGVTAIVIN